MGFSMLVADVGDGLCNKNHVDDRFEVLVSNVSVIVIQYIKTVTIKLSSTSL